MTNEEPAAVAEEREPPDPAFFFTWRGIDFEWKSSRFAPVLGVYSAWSVVGKGRRWCARILISAHWVAAEGSTPERALEAALSLWAIDTNNALHAIAPGYFTIDGEEELTFKPEAYL